MMDCELGTHCFPVLSLDLYVKKSNGIGKETRGCAKWLLFHLGEILVTLFSFYRENTNLEDAGSEWQNWVITKP